MVSEAAYKKGCISFKLATDFSGSLDGTDAGVIRRFFPNSQARPQYY
jgi:hypothetical protein